MRNILVLGGDCRQIAVAEEFSKGGDKVRLYGFEDEYISSGCLKAGNLSEAVKECDMIIAGLPATTDGETVNAPLFTGKIYIDEIIKHISSDSLFIGGMLSEEIKNKFRGVCKTADYCLCEELIIKNVVPTVEGAVAIAINETPFTLNKSKCLVAGYGRIGKYLSRILSAMNAEVTVSARKRRDFAWLDCFALKYTDTGKIYETAGEYNIIFNTVPYLVIDKKCIDNLDKDCVIIDLASKPGGIDFSYAAKKGIKVVWALSLPGKTAPVTAGRIIKEATDNLLKDMGV